MECPEERIDVLEGLGILSGNKEEPRTTVTFKIPGVKTKGKESPIEEMKRNGLSSGDWERHQTLVLDEKKYVSARACSISVERLLDRSTQVSSVECGKQTTLVPHCQGRSKQFTFRVLWSLTARGAPNSSHSEYSGPSLPGALTSLTPNSSHSESSWHIIIKPVFSFTGVSI